MAKARLGKGLQALITDMESLADEGVRNIALDYISPNPYQPRRSFSDDQLRELADSIKQHGVIQPVTVRPRGDRFELVVGERRLRAAKLAGLADIPALVRDMTDLESAEIAIIENLQREDLNPLEEAAAFNHLLLELDYTQEKIAERLGKSRSHIANTLRLLALPKVAADLVARGQLSAGQARAVLAAPPHLRESFALRIADRGMTVREAEKAAQGLQNVSRETIGRQDKPTLPLEYREVEARLREFLQVKVALKHQGPGGAIEVSYHSAEELERLLELLTRQAH